MIGEAVKNLPEDARNRAPAIEGKKIAGLRDIIAHGYFGVDDEILWNIVTQKVLVHGGAEWCILIPCPPKTRQSAKA